MSDENRIQSCFSDDVCDECAPTEHDAGRPSHGLPPRGAALSVLWWLDGEGDPISESARLPG